MNKAITFAQLQTLLQGLGFHETVLPSSHLVFSGPEPKMLLFYRVYRPDEVLDWTDLAKPRRFLDAWGLVEESAFETLLQAPAA
jgi:hypothetical protein